MEVTVRAEESEQGCIENSCKSGLESAALKKVAEPIVYQLVRVDCDGRLVPATDEELAEVENLLAFENNEMYSMSDVFDTVGQGLEKDVLETFQTNGSTQFMNEDDEDGTNPHLKDSVDASESNSKLSDISQNITDNSCLEEAKFKSDSSDSGPNFSWLKGEINLDNLTCRELQETFRATFGRKTTVKDKSWLKRRIAMGLSNSCEDSIAREVGCSEDDISANLGSHSDMTKDVADGVVSMSSSDDSGCKTNDMPERRAAKRARKPTKRFIEEFSDKETSEPTGKSISSPKCTEQDKPSLSSDVKAAWSVNTGAFVTRRDSFGGSGVQVPYVSRARRCRPRQSITTLVNFDSSDVTLMRKNVEISDGPNKAQFDTSSMVKLVDIIPVKDPVSCINELPEKQSVTTMSDSSPKQEPQTVDTGHHALRDDAAGVNSDDNVATVPTAKGGVRRKHHRAWTLTEVTKLVDGVSKFGPGRWSEIKRLSFSSYTYRTAVDLKDKWRNLLKASFATLSVENGMNPRMKTPFLIPASILVKVRELADINGQAPKTTQNKQRQ
ncbi:hypothetical protein vseg_004090 [Gypsophila vaccaria]